MMHPNIHNVMSPASNSPNFASNSIYTVFCFSKMDDVEGKFFAGPSILELLKDHCGTDNV